MINIPLEKVLLSIYINGKCWFSISWYSHEYNYTHIQTTNEMTRCDWIVEAFNAGILHCRLEIQGIDPESAPFLAKNWHDTSDEAGNNQTTLQLP